MINKKVLVIFHSFAQKLPVDGFAPVIYFLKID